MQQAFLADRILCLALVEVAPSPVPSSIPVITWPTEPSLLLMRYPKVFIAKAANAAPSKYVLDEGIKVVVALAAGLCFHLHCGSTPGGGSHRVLLRTVSWWNYRTVGGKVDWSEGRSYRG